MLVLRFFWGVRSLCAVFDRFFEADSRIELSIFFLLVEFCILLRKSWPNYVLLLMYWVLGVLALEAPDPIFWNRFKYLLRVSWRICTNSSNILESIYKTFIMSFPYLLLSYY